MFKFYEPKKEQLFSNKRRLSLAFFTFLFLLFSLNSVYGQKTYTFTPAGASGTDGPTQTQVDNAYSKTSLDGTVKVTKGTQKWVVPSTGIYRITASGAQGGTMGVATGGLGAEISGDIALIKGTELYIMVGQVGGVSNAGGGGGGSGIYVGKNCLIAAGGGGGGTTQGATENGTSGLTSTSADKSSGAAGINGNGGGKGFVSGDCGFAGGGGGFLGSGFGSTNTPNDGGVGTAGGPGGGISALDGGFGGIGGGCNNLTTGAGGFGFGGGGHGSYGGGGGGGYSGGGGGQYVGAANERRGGGGGSYNSGTKQKNTAGVNSGNGKVVITALSSGAFNDLGVIGIDSPTVFCPGTYPVVVSIVNYGISRVDSVTINWTVNGTLQTPKKYMGLIDSFGGSNPNFVQLSIGNYAFSTNNAYLIKAWTSSPNGVSDTVSGNDTAISTKKSSLPPPTASSVDTLNAYDAYITWAGGSKSNSWLYLNVPKGTKPIGGTATTNQYIKLNNLNPQTEYDFYVREVCPGGDTSAWAGPLLYKTPCAVVLSGTYTINKNQAASSTNFISFTSAVSSLTQCGVKGPVILNVSADTYTERLIIDEIPGASATNTIQFIGAGRASTTITFNSTTTATMATIVLNGADYITFKNMTIAAPNVTYGVGVILTNKANYNNFINLDINCSVTATGTLTGGIISSGSITTLSTLGDNANYTKIDSVNIKGGYYGVSFYGISTAGLQTIGNSVTNSTFDNVYNYGVRIYAQDEFICTLNKMTNFRLATNYAIYNYYSSNFEIVSNNIQTNYIGLYCYYGNFYNYKSNKATKIHSNISNSSYSGSIYSIYLSSSHYLQVYHNTIIGTYTSGGILYFTGCNNADIQNNIMVNKGSGATSYSIYITGGSISKMDYNIYVTAGTNLAFHIAAQADLATWRTNYSSYNVNSSTTAPNFSTPIDGHLDFSLPAASGPYIGVDIDVDGDVRCNLAATIGADESSFILPPPNAYFATNDTTFINSNTRFINTSTTNANEKVRYFWYVDGKQVSTDKDLIYSFPSDISYTVSMKIQSCFGVDSTGKTITVDNPTSTPISDFIANKTITEMFEDVQLTSISKHGATSWKWEAFPDVDAYFSDETDPNPTIAFYVAGVYDICLTTANDLGQGTKTCKKTYIAVNDDVFMCGVFNSSFSAFGTIADDGDVYAKYGNNKRCSFVIKPCAVSVNLKFNSFELADASDSIAIYDGPNNKGKLIGSYNGSFTGIPGGFKGLTANSGTMYIEWTTGPSGVANGFDAAWSSVLDTNILPPIAGFTYPANVYTGQEATFISTSTGKNIQYAWDFNPPANLGGLNGGKTEIDRYKWNTPGTKNVQLIASNCGGADTILQQINVKDITSAPIVNFGATKTRVPVISQITLIDSSDQAPTSYKWEITPSNKVVYVNSKTSRNPIVYFTSPGYYTVKLVATNALGSDSLTKTNYIEVFSYCTPAVAALSSDVGISRVHYGNIDNITTIGKTNYTSFFDSYAAPLFFKEGNFDITIDRNTNTDSMSRKVWIDWNQNGVFTDSGELVVVENASKQLSFTGNIQVPSTVPVGVTIMRIGTSYASANNSPCGINPSGEFEDYPIEIAVDNIKPEITRLGAETLYVEQWYALNDPGVTIMDNLDGDITHLVFTNTNFDSTTVGTYIIKYNITDKAGNIANEVTRTVVVTPDVTPAIITLNGNAVENVEVFDTYIDADAVATDYFNRDITGSIQKTDNIDMNVLGTYTYTYTVTDGGGNITIATRTVNVIDGTAPIITSTGTDTVYVNVFENLNDAGFTAADNYDQASDLVLTYDSSAFNSNKTGTYMVKYFAKDLSGNIGSKNIVVIVRDTKAPVITLIGKTSVNLDVFNDYIEQGANVTDNYCTSTPWIVTGNVNTDVVGPYTMTYSAIDCENNQAIEVTRTVNVVDRIAPELELIGPKSVNIKEREIYSDLGINVSDNYYSENTLRPLIKVTDNIDNTKGGIYSICYDLKDPSNNKASQVCRTVNVIAFGAGVQNVINKNVELYPNPNNGEFTITNKEGFNNTSIVVTDLLGKVIYTTKANGTNEVNLNLNDVAAGIYLVNIQEGNQAQNIKISVVK